MIVGGNSKALSFFRARGVTDDVTGRARYSSKAAQQYKAVLEKAVSDDPLMWKQEVKNNFYVKSKIKFVVTR